MVMVASMHIIAYHKDVCIGVSKCSIDLSISIGENIQKHSETRNLIKKLITRVRETTNKVEIISNVM